MDRSTHENAQGETSFIPDSALSHQIIRLAAQGNLEAVVVHLNDTYLIQERAPSVPGLARVATFIADLKSFVEQQCGKDRTLVMHSGDFLSPSVLSQQFHGRQMVDVLNRIGLNFATLGNHEFDFGPDNLASRLEEAQFRIVVSNLEPATPTGKPLERVVYWPDDHEPSIAIIGLLSEGVARSAAGCTFSTIAATLKELAPNLKSRSIGRLIVLSHASQDDDRELQRILNVYRGDAFGEYLILGGHDHHIDWDEKGLSKNLSNCRSITVFVVSVDSLCWGYRTRLEDLERKLEDDLTVADAVRMIQCSDDIFGARYPEDLEKCIDHLPSRVQAAFRRRLHATAGNFCLLDDALLYDSLSDDDYYGEIDFTGRYKFTGEAIISRFKPDPAVDSVVKSWLSRSNRSEQLDVLCDLSAYTGSLDADDESLRSRSTDFGNLIVDCIKNASGADIALLNAGSFRCDDQLPPTLTASHIDDAFLFDSPSAIAFVTLTAIEVSELLALSDSEVGHGRVLQRTELTPEMLQSEHTLKVAISSYSITSNFDGYQSALARSRNCSLQDLPAHLKPWRDPSSIKFLISSAIGRVSYSASGRFSCASRTPEDELIDQFIRLIKDYRRLCIAEYGPESIGLAPTLFRFPESFAQHNLAEPSSKFLRGRGLACQLVHDVARSRGLAYTANVSKRIQLRAEQLRSGIPYSAYWIAALSCMS